MEQNPFLAPLRFLAMPFRKKVWIILGVAFFIWIILSAPTGWIYDLGVGTGTEQGQMPDKSVQMVNTQTDAEDFFFQATPATVSKEGLIQCPLMRLRDTEYAGEHTSTRKRTVVISEYVAMSYPINAVRKLLFQIFGVSAYNSYYLAPLQDGSYICVYFDDYLLLHSGGELPTGYVRYATTEEKTMLHQMTEDYEVNPVYVLDMYRHGKVNWMLDFLIRFVVAISVVVAVMSVLETRKKIARRKVKE